MTDLPNIYLNDPDPLSVLLTRLDLKAEVYVDGNFCGTWAVDTGGSKRIPFHLIGSGKAWLHLEQDTPQELTAQDLVIFPHDAHHVISNSSVKPEPDKVNAPMSNDGETTNMVCGFFEFGNPALFPILNALPNVVVVKAEHNHAKGRVKQLIGLMLSELKEQRRGYYNAIDHMAFLIFIEVIRSQVEDGELREGLLHALFDARLGKALNAIHQCPQSPWTLESLAQEALMSRSTFVDSFNKAIGLTPMKYLTQWRMSEARKLLQSTALSVSQIAEKSGYESEAAFRKAYRNTLGEPPGAVRGKSG